MLRRASLVVLFVVLMPATVSAFDHEHHHDSDSDSDGCKSSSSSSSSSTSSSGSVPTIAPSLDPTQKRVFVTSTSYSGAIGSVSVADAQCHASAEAAGISGTFKAWISDASTNAYDRTGEVGPWYNTAGDVVFYDKSGLRGPPSASILDEHGSLGSTGNGPWTGSNEDGVSTGSDCEGWTNAGGDVTATLGSSLSLDRSWGGGSQSVACNAKAPILCFQQ